MIPHNFKTYPERGAIYDCAVASFANLVNDFDLMKHSNPDGLHIGDVSAMCNEKGLGLICTHNAYFIQPCTQPNILQLLIQKCRPAGYGKNDCLVFYVENARKGNDEDVHGHFVICNCQYQTIVLVDMLLDKPKTFRPVEYFNYIGALNYVPFAFHLLVDKSLSEYSVFDANQFAHLFDLVQ